MAKSLSEIINKQYINKYNLGVMGFHRINCIDVIIYTATILFK